MTEVDFYILPSDTLAARDHFACRLTEKVFHQGRHIAIQAMDQAHAESLSDYLWSFKPESFLPHVVIAEPNKNIHPATRIVIGWQEPDERFHDVLINLSKEIPTAFSRFHKLSEIVVQDAELLPITRSHFQFYRDRGYPLQSHKIG